LRSGIFNQLGTWSGMTTSGIPIIGNNWDSYLINSGTYQFKYRVNNIVCNTFDEAIITIIFNPIPQIPVINANSNYCLNQTIQFNISNSVNNQIYSWIGPNSFTSSLKDPLITNCQTINSGIYTVTTTSNGCSSSSSITINVLNLNLPNSGLERTVNFCGNNGIIDLFSLFTSTYDVGGTWQEVSSSGIPINGNLWNSTNANSGIYKFKYKVTSTTCGSFAETIMTIILKPIPTIPNITVSNTVCQNETIQFNISNPTVGATYSWSGPNSFSSNIRNPFIQNSQLIDSGMYQVTSNLNGCITTNSTSINVKKAVDFELIGSCDGGKFTVIANPLQNSFVTSNANYQWTGPNNFSSSVNPIIILNSTDIGDYNLKVTNVDGCFAIKTINVLSTSCFITAGISPNDDGLNENFDISFLGQNLKLEIFNRYGTKVFEQYNYTNQWHGQDYNNSLLPDATYFYCIKPENGENKVGWVYLTKEIK
jgi:gliding motility-associated-like protein